MQIEEFLNPEAIILNLEADNSKQVIRELGGKLLELGYVTDDFIEATLAREASMPTGLPLSGSVNAAIPHVDIQYVKKSALALATLQQEVVFYSMVENEVEVPCRLVIMLALDAPKSQVDMLQSVAELLQQPSVIDAIITAENAEEILAALR